MRLSRRVEDFIYKKIIRNIMLMSTLGKQSVLGEAATGYNFDHMYENKPSGYPIIGQLVDLMLLNLPAVKATRNRKTTICKILANEIENHKVSGEVSKIIDIACGAGRYLLDIGEMFQSDNVEILGVDFDLKSIQHGEALAKKYGASAKNTRFFRGNVFKLQFLKRFGKTINWAPNIIISSGLTVYIDDEKVLEMLKQVFEAIDVGGLFLMDSQVNNPSRKLMEKVCNTKEGPWILHYRNSEFWREKLYSVGFRDIRISGDPWNMYNICTARKP